MPKTGSTSTGYAHFIILVIIYSSSMAWTCLWKAIFDGFGEFEAQNVAGHRVDPKKALPCVTTRVLSHRAWNSMHGLLQ